ncbi:DUF2461 domain-containing protein [Flavobacterium sp. xlx-214]|uniref:DUF2461 domain-containing protein n=1 Tax=unclassified Flavobacterium TaxID=196869 RepID=UPI0013D5B296|nr:MULTISPECIES: DUF2461 domain-containing protein [unclassified Flavobacterium]MBA5793221.1 DUF2461 domain-containing protein [Flavobacterium sp. xlx-221]QMI82496.1 DUF2461 domain-containing protein [Flavobacterium sp. xlx-214]
MEKKVLDFLKKLEKNNNREWFQDNKTIFEDSKQSADVAFQEVYKKLSSSDELSPLKIYRIYRDVRFSTDKTPYKNHFSMYVGRQQPDNRGGYYLHIQPGESFIGVGFFGPNKEDLLRIRKEIELDDELQQILQSKEIKKTFGDLVGEEVKTAPKGFNKEHERINLIKKKQFLLIHKLSDEDVLSKDFTDKVVTVFKASRPFVNYITDVLLTNLNGEKI